MGGFKQFHHFVSVAAIFKPRWWAFVTRAPWFFKKVVPFKHLTLNWSCNPGERNAWSWHFWGTCFSTATVNTFWRMSSCPLGDYMGTASEKFWSIFWDILTKFVEISLIILVCLVGRAGILLCLDQILNKTISWSLMPNMTRTSETKEGT